MDLKRQIVVVPSAAGPPAAGRAPSGPGPARPRRRPAPHPRAGEAR
jgi:hypothetical protein